MLEVVKEMYLMLKENKQKQKIGKYSLYFI